MERGACRGSPAFAGAGSACAGTTERGDGMTEKNGLVMEGPGRCLRMMTATPVPMLGVRPWGRVASATTLRQPHTSGGMWTRREEESSLWGSLVHRKCSTIPRDGSGDPRPAFVVGSSLVVTTVESKKGVLVLSRRSSDWSDSPATCAAGESG